MRKPVYHNKALHQSLAQTQQLRLKRRHYMMSFMLLLVSLFIAGSY